MTGFMGYDLGGPWRGMLTHHSDACPARLGQPCTCGPLGYRAAIDNVQGQAPVLGPVLPTVEEARAWQQEQHTAMHAFEAAARPMDGNGPQGAAPPLDTSAVWAARPVETHGYQATAQPNTVAAVVDEFLEGVRAGAVTDPGGRPYEPEQFRDLRWSLRGYVASELGAMRIAELNGATLHAFVGHLDATGLAQARTRSVVRALRALLRYAAERGMVPWSTPDLLRFGDADEQPYTAPHAAPPNTRPVTAAFGVADEQPYAAPLDTWPVSAAPPATTPQQAPASISSGSVPDEVIWLILKIVTLVFALIALVLVAESV